MKIYKFFYRNKIIVFLIMLIFACTILSACVKDTGIVTGIAAEERVVTTENVTTLTDIYVIRDGKRVRLGYEEFWFVAKYVYVQDGNLKVKDDAPMVFSDRLKIIYRKNELITQTIEIEKIYVPLESVTLSGKDDKKTCIVGESLQLNVSFNPENATDKNVVYSILGGDGSSIAEISQTGLLSVNESASAGSTVTVRVEARHERIPDEMDDIDTDEITITVTERVSLDSPQNFYQKIQENPSGDYILTVDLDFGEINNRLPIPLFSGTLKGNGKTISNIAMDIPDRSYREEKDFGLFAVCGGTITDLNLSNVSIASVSYHGGKFVNVGALAGTLTNDGIIENVTVEGTVQAHRRYSRIGGIIGYVNGGTVKNCIASMTLYGNGDMGTIAGYASGSLIYGCKSNTSLIRFVVQYDNRSAGGILGSGDNATIEQCNIYNTIIRYEGAGGIAEEDLRPHIGCIVGCLNGGAILSVGKDENSYIDAGGLKEAYKYGGLGAIGAKTNNQKIFVGNGPWGVYGQATNAKVI
ncbi:MAG: Ig-like domain-containing protein [Clostridiales bacterium]|jgi:hypothetical protein|nr:Ig-like domain-containing protein [Clostridiales bacterium]